MKTAIMIVMKILIIMIDNNDNTMIDNYNKNNQDNNNNENNYGNNNYITLILKTFP